MTARVSLCHCDGMRWLARLPPEVRLTTERDSRDSFIWSKIPIESQQGSGGPSHFAAPRYRTIQRCRSASKVRQQGAYVSDFVYPCQTRASGGGPPFYNLLPIHVHRCYSSPVEFLKATTPSHPPNQSWSSPQYGQYDKCPPK